MKKIIFFFAIALIATSCGKMTKGKKQYSYYCEDYSDADVDVLGVNTDDVDKMYVIMNNEVEDKNNYPESYTLFVETGDQIYTESGTIDSDWKTTISFTTANGDTYAGAFQEDKGTYKLNYEFEERIEELTFVWKDKCK